jgi:hypothetical protein
MIDKRKLEELKDEVKSILRECASYDTIGFYASWLAKQKRCVVWDFRVLAKNLTERDAYEISENANTQLAYFYELGKLRKDFILEENDKICYAIGFYDPKKSAETKSRILRELDSRSIENIVREEKAL